MNRRRVTEVAESLGFRRPGRRGSLPCELLLWCEREHLRRSAAALPVAAIERGEHDPVQPGTQVRAGRELVELQICTRERVLDQVLGVAWLVGEPERDGVKLPH